MANNAVNNERVSKVVGYLMGKFSNNVTPNLPQRVAIFAEANEANQAGLSLTPVSVTTAQQAGELYGFGSPIYTIMRVLRPVFGGGIGGIPTVVYPQAVGVSAVAKVYDITPTGTATGNGTHTIYIAGRSGLDGTNYDINIVTGDVVATITAKIMNAVNNVLGNPFIATDATTKAVLTAKWKGLSSNGITVTVDDNGKDLGITYAVVSATSGSVTPSLTPALTLLAGNEWNTILIDSYGTTATMNAIEAFNGIPDPLTPTGRFTGIIMKPLIALVGSVLDNPTTLTSARKTQVTVSICPAPLSAGMPFEAAANVARLYARQAQDDPHLDISGMSYPDMPTPLSIGLMANYENRDLFVKDGCSTVDLVAGQYKVMDFVTTYHPDGETPPQYRNVRSLNIDFNIKFGYHLLEEVNVVDHVIANDNDIVDVQKVIKPKQWIQIVGKYADDLAKRALISDPQFTQDSLNVAISATNPDRLETIFRYKRTGFVRIAATTAEAGFNL